MIRSKYVAGVPIPAFDSAVTEALDYPNEGGGKEMRIAIEAVDGAIYRVVQTVGMGAFIHAIQSLLELGFTDALADATGSVAGFDARMVPGPEIESSVILKDDDIEEDLNSLSDRGATERAALITARLGQGAFRAAVVKHWGVCAVSGADCVPLLRASHIKPWRDSSDQERLDPDNGLLLTPNLDAAFDLGYITFEDTGRILLSASAAGSVSYQLHMSPKMKLNAKLLTAAHRKYLHFHRESVFLA